MVSFWFYYDFEMGAETMVSGDTLGSVGHSDEMSEDPRLPKPPKIQVSARVERAIVKRLDHYVELLKAFAQAEGEDEDVIDSIDRSHAAREAIGAGLDVLLNKFGGWPETDEARQAQLAAVRKGKPPQPK